MRSVDQQSCGERIGGEALSMASRARRGVNRWWMRGSVLVVGSVVVDLVACGVDDRSVTVGTRADIRAADGQAADLGACEPGDTLPGCIDGYLRVCSTQGQWVLLACDADEAGSAAAMASAGGARSADAGGVPADISAAAAAGSAMGRGAGALPAGGVAGSATAAAARDAGPATAANPTPPLSPAAPGDGGITLGDCRFEYLGEWVRCENSGTDSAAWVGTDAPDLMSCMQQCLARADCTGVTDWLWLGTPDLGCRLYVSTCDAPAFVSWGEEDGGREYRRVCSTAAP
jgi:hypothetical protein